MHLSFGPYDAALVVGVSLQATLLAQLREPRWKAAALSLPLPFTLATLSVGKPVAASNVLALVLLYGFTQGVRVLHQEWRVPILPAIIAADGGYILVGSALAGVVPGTERAFWAAEAGVFALGVWLYLRLPHRTEPGHRSPLPVWIKLPAITGVILILVVIKSLLQGFMTLFPMVGTVAAYEARYSLWTIGRQIPILMITFTPMMAACRLVQVHAGLTPALALGWAVYLAAFVPLTRADWAAAGGGGVMG